MAADQQAHTPPEGAQRLALAQVHAWETLGYGMFIHFGLSTYDGDELSLGDQPSSVYAPDHLDVDQWVQVARDAGMRYAVLTAKHVAGHCLWPSKHTEYHVGTSGNHTDVVEAFVTACQKHGIAPGLYYCSWDNHHRLGSLTPTAAQTFTGGLEAFTTAAYRDFQMAQMEELLTQYGPISEVWIDIPQVLGQEGRRQQYDQIARLQPDAVIMLNQGITDGTAVQVDKAWPTDIMAIERSLPTSHHGYTPWFHLTVPGAGDQPQLVTQDYYLPGEVCDPIGYEWFHVPTDPLRSDAELLALRLLCQARGVNLLLDVPPDRHGVIPHATVAALTRLQRNLEHSGVTSIAAQARRQRRSATARTATED